MKRLRVGVPLLHSQLTGSGGWIAGLYYVRNCLNALAALPGHKVPEVVAFMPETLAEPLLFPENRERSPWLTELRLPTDVIRSSPSKLQEHFDHYRCDVLFPVATLPQVSFSAPAIGWIPDFQHRHYPRFFSYEEYAGRELEYAFIVGHCDRIACSSQAVRDDLGAFYPELKEKGTVLRFTALLPEQSLAEDPGRILEKLGVTRPYVYLPSQFWVHKNHAVAFEALKEVVGRGRDCLLVCSGQGDDYRFPGHMKQLEAYLDEHSLRPHVRLLGFVEREEQIQLFRGARLVLQPSLFEGWSTTVEESKTLGKALVVSDIPVHREQCGSAATYFAKDDPRSLAEALEAGLDSAPEGHDPAGEARALEAARTRALTFGESLVRVLEEAVEARRREPRAGHERGLTIPLFVGLTRRLEASEADRAARGEVLAQQEAQHSAQLAACQADSAARLEVIQRMSARAKEVNDLLEAARPTGLLGLFSPFRSARTRDALDRSLRLLRDLLPR